MADPVTLALLVAGGVLAASEPGRAATKHAVTSGYRATGWRTPPKALVHHSGRAGAATGRLIGKASRANGQVARASGRLATQAGRRAGSVAAQIAERRWHARRLQPVPLLWRDRPPTDRTNPVPSTSAIRPAQPKAPTTSAPGGTTPEPPTQVAPIPPTPAPVGAERSSTTMSRRFAINLEPPSSDSEFLETLAHLVSVFRSVAEEVQEWAGGVASLGLDSSVTSRLETVPEGLTVAADGASQTASAFEDSYEETRDIASKGMRFLGEDAA